MKQQRTTKEIQDKKKQTIKHTETEKQKRARRITDTNKINNNMKNIHLQQKRKQIKQEMTTTTKPTTEKAKQDKHIRIYVNHRQTYEENKKQN